MCCIFMSIYIYITNNHAGLRGRPRASHKCLLVITVDSFGGDGRVSMRQVKDTIPTTQVATRFSPDQQQKHH